MTHDATNAAPILMLELSSHLAENLAHSDLPDTDRTVCLCAGHFERRVEHVEKLTRTSAQLAKGFELFAVQAISHFFEQEIRIPDQST
jgi:hypothetical protein